MLQLGELVRKIEKELEEAKVEAKEKQLLYKNCVSTVSLLEKSINEHGKQREGRLKDLEKKIKATKAQMQSASKDLKVELKCNSQFSPFVFPFFVFFFAPLGIRNHALYSRNNLPYQLCTKGLWQCCLFMLSFK